MSDVLYTISQAAQVPVITPGGAPASAPTAAPAPSAAPAATSTAPASGAAATTAAQGAAKQQPQADVMSGLFGMWPIVAMLVAFYFLLIRPQQKREKERQKQLKALEKGDKVLTRGGIFGTIVGIKEDDNVAIVKIADDVKVEVAISTLENVVNKAAT